MAVNHGPYDRSPTTVPASAIVTPPQYPDVMTEAETIHFLRLDLIGIKNPAESLRRYRRLGLLRGTQLGKCIRYRRSEVEKFLDELTRLNPR
jgi:hypothetical protein